MTSTDERPGHVIASGEHAEIEAEATMTAEDELVEEDREPTAAESIAAEILGGLDSEDPPLPIEVRSTLPSIVGRVLDVLDERKADAEGDHIDIEAMVDDLEIGELKLLEEATGSKLAKILREFESNDFGADTIAAIVWISLRRDDPEATIEDADRIKLRQIAELDDDDDEAPDPQ